MKIAFVSSEYSPVAHTGGLGDAVAGLTAQLHANGHDVCVILPYYRAARKYHYWKKKQTGVTLSIPVGGRTREAGILEYRKRGGHQIFFIANDDLFERDGLYGEGSTAYPDNAERFIFFSKAAVELCRRMDPKPDIIHCHDWQTALAPVLVRARGLPFRTLLTIHNIAYQGQFWSIDFALTNLPPEQFSPASLEFYGNLNLLKGGLLAADRITTVSDSYARDIQTPEFGCGLDAVLREQRHKLHGFLIGVDYSVWNPGTDKSLPKTFRPSALKGKAVCGEELLARLNLDPSPRGPILMMASRITEQKGLGILLPLLDRLLADDVRLIILGEGDEDSMARLTVAARRHARRFAYVPRPENKLAHLTVAGSEINLVPSRFEPGGHSAIKSLRYGTIPVARATGGLHEIVRDYDPTQQTGWGILFHEYSPDALWDAIHRAKKLHAERKTWKSLVERAMRLDFSWEKSAAAYETVYNQLLKSR